MKKVINCVKANRK